MKPLNIISLGAGVQSSTLALMAAHGEVGPLPDGAIFADTKAEPQSVYRWLDWLEKQLPFPVYRVSKGDLSKEGLIMRKTKDGRLYARSDIPVFTRNHNGTEGKIRNRACTKDFKIVPIIAKCRQLVQPHMAPWKAKHKDALKQLSEWAKAVKAARAKKTNEPMRPFSAWTELQSDPLVVQWVGISLDEINRMKESRDGWAFNRWPLVEKRMTRHDCKRWMQAKGYPEPPRSSCVFCPFHNNDEWRRLKESEPEEWQKAVAFEKEYQRIKASTQNFNTTPYLHRQLVPLEQVDLSTEEERGQGNLFDNECEGMCGV